MIPARFLTVADNCRSLCTSPRLYSVTRSCLAAFAVLLMSDDQNEHTDRKSHTKQLMAASPIHTFVVNEPFVDAISRAS
jgi:hypothetical protein